MKASFLFISATFLVFATAQFNNDINTNSISFVTPITATTTMIENNDNNPTYPAITISVTETSTTTTLPKQTIATPSTITTTSNDATRLFMMKSSQLAAIVVLAYLVFLI